MIIGGQEGSAAPCVSVRLLHVRLLAVRVPPSSGSWRSRFRDRYDDESGKKKQYKIAPSVCREAVLQAGLSVTQ